MLVILIISLIVASSLLVSFLDAYAHQNFSSKYGVIADYSPYRSGVQRVITPLEIAAQKAIYRRINNRSDTEPMEMSVLHPLWLLIWGLIADGLFAFGVLCFFYWCSTETSGLFRFVVTAYFLGGVAVFFYDVLGRGDIGRIGYHMRFCLTAVLWPVFILATLSGIYDKN